MLEDFRLKVFMAVVKERNFTKAAAYLGISQPAVSQNISELEKISGARLFERLPGEVALTRKGLIFHKYARRILDSYDTINMIFSDLGIADRDAEHPVCVYISPLVGTLVEGDIIESALQLKPSLSMLPVQSQEDADVCILALVNKKDVDFNVKVNVLSSNPSLESFFREVLNLYFASLL